MKTHKFTWIDGLIIAVIILLAAGTAVKFLVLDKTAVTRQTTPITYQVKIEGVRQYTVDALAVGDTLYETEGKGAVGIIEDVTAAPAEMTTGYPDGTVQTVSREGRFDVTLTVSAEAVLEDSVYKVGVYRVRVGHTGDYFTKYSAWMGTVCSLSEAAS